MRTNVCVVAMLLVACVSVRAESKETTMAQFTLSSPSFRNNQPMPAKHSCEGEDASPALKWDGAPAGTKSFALICDDPDAPGGTWVHWVIYGMGVSTTELPERVVKTDTVAALGGVKQGMNDFGNSGYGGPCPPRGHGIHHYHFRLYALDAELNLAPRVKRHQLDAAMKGHILAQTELVGTYQRD
jgi:Raf kinase inhibitor-like YbhB/YbcL family protein